MNNILFYVDEYKDGNALNRDGLVFNNVRIIKLLVDGEDIEDDENFQDSLIYFDELKDSYASNGKYLIFTCACGNALDGGWEGVEVIIEKDTVKWEFEVGDRFYNFSFTKEQYIHEIKTLDEYLGVETNLILEPQNVIFPNNFNRALEEKF